MDAPGPSLPLLAAAVLTLAAGGCVVDTPTAPSTSQASLVSAPFQLARLGTDGEFERIAREAPGFAGMFYDVDGRLNVLVKSEVLRSTQAVDDVFSRVTASLRVDGRAVPARGDVIFLEATRDFTELIALHDRVLPMLAQPGVVFTDIDEAQNRLRIGVLDDGSGSMIRAELQQMAIPDDAVTLELTPPAVPVGGTLRSFQDPIGGGLQIAFQYGPYFYICTLGFNVLLGAPERAQTYFFTNSHCTGDVGVVTGTEYWMPLPPGFPGDNHFVGTEAIDPPFFASPCYTGWVCRWSDAALVRYAEDAPAKLGTIYGTTAVGTGGSFGSIVIDEVHRPLFVAAEQPHPLMGEVLDKIGSSSGWTRGPVVGTCVDYAYSLNPLQAMLCQDVVSAGVFPGDSGAPVFQPLGASRNVKLYGILWGEVIGPPPIPPGPLPPLQYILSAVDNLRYEFGGPDCRLVGPGEIVDVRCPQDRVFRTH